MDNSGKLIYPDLSYKITGILFAVHNELGQFCSEGQYCDLIEEFLKKYKMEYDRDRTYAFEVKMLKIVYFLINKRLFKAFLIKYLH